MVGHPERVTAVVGLRRTLALALLILVVAAGPATADAAEPGDYRSEVTSVEPDPGGFTIETAGGDAFLALRVDEGTEVLVLGYEGEPYLRFGADGVVERNRNSPATYINDERFGAGDLVPADLAGQDVTTLEPDWEQVATGGTYAWHDHRTHLMTPDPPVARGESFPWSTPVVLEVDGERIEVQGEITYEDDVAGVVWLGVAVLAAAAVIVAGARIGDRGLAATLSVVALAAVVVAWIGYADQPPDTGASIVPVVVALIALGLAVVSLSGRLVAVTLLAGGVFLATWGVFRVDVLTDPVLPTTVPFAVDRLVTALAIGVGAGAVVGALRSGALAGALVPVTDD